MKNFQYNLSRIKKIEREELLKEIAEKIIQYQKTQDLKAIEEISDYLSLEDMVFIDNYIQEKFLTE